jgi:riboflavin synthase
MFTGLIEAVGEVAAVETTVGGCRLSILTGLAGSLVEGESVAVNGVCLTAIATGGDAVQADVGPETLRVTTLGSLRPGRQVNLERSMRAGGRFGGHFVQGHVDGTGTLRDVRRDGDATWLTIAVPEGLSAFFVRKGSVAVDGISLTVAELRRDAFDVMIVPFTWDHTALPSLRPRDQVNIECDMLGKYVVRALELRQS